MPRTLSEQEFTAIKAKVLASAPDNMSEQNFNLWATNALPAAIAEAEGQPAGSATARFFGGAATNLNPITAIEGLATAARHPLDTAANIGTAQLRELQKAAADFKAGRYSEMAGHAAAGALPILGPAASAAGERMATGDIAGGLGEGAGLLTPFVAADAVRGGRAVARGAVQSVRAVPQGAAALDALAALADRASTNRIVDVAGPKTGANKTRFANELTKAAPALAREPDLGAFSRQGFATKIEARLDAAAGGLDDAADARLVSQQVKTAPLLKHIDAAIDNLTAHPVEGSQWPRTANVPGVTKADQLQGITGEIGARDVATTRPAGLPVEPAPNAAEIGTLRKMRTEVAQLGATAPYEAIRRIRAAWDKVAKVKYMPSTAQDVLKAQGDATGAAKGTAAMREALASTDPASAAANADYHLFKSASDALKATEEAERVRPKNGRRMFSRLAGGVAGAERGGAAGGVLGVMIGSMLERAAELAPTLKIVVARKLATAADLLRAGQGAQAQRIAQSAWQVFPKQPVRAAVRRTAVPGGRITIAGLEAGLPTAADNQSEPPPAIGQR